MEIELASLAIGFVQTGLLCGIFLRLGRHEEKLNDTDRRIKTIEERIRLHGFS